MCSDTFGKAESRNCKGNRHLWAQFPLRRKAALMDLSYLGFQSSAQAIPMLDTSYSWVFSSCILCLNDSRGPVNFLTVHLITGKAQDLQAPTLTIVLCSGDSTAWVWWGGPVGAVTHLKPSRTRHVFSYYPLFSKSGPSYTDRYWESRCMRSVHHFCILVHGTESPYQMLV